MTGPLLWTHFGASGPAVLDVSRHWLRARLEGHAATLAACLLPGVDFAAADRWLVEMVRERPRLLAANALGLRIPAGMGAIVCGLAQVDAQTTLGQLTRDARRRLARALTEWRLPVVDSRGYDYAEVTAGGIALREVDPRSMRSRVCPGLFLVGEMLDVDGRLGGFNFQWAWASAKAAARGIVGTLSS